MTAVVCPDELTLQRLLAGQVAGEPAEELEAHLSTCDGCVQTAARLIESDELVEAVKAAGTAPRDDDSVSRLVERLKSMQADSINTQLDETHARSPDSHKDEPTLAVSERDRAPAGELSFLDPPQSDEEIGRVGRFRVMEIMGRGGMGVVLRAEDPQLRREVAIKVLHVARVDRGEATARFLREAQATAAIEHDNIVTIHDVGEQRGMPYYAMQFLRGESLHDRLRREKQLPIAEAVRIAREIAQGLSAAHAKGLLHRDIKPANVWLEAETDRVKIVDFGLARLDDHEESDLTNSGAILGTPKYMSPEQAQGEAVDARCDLFSLGSVLFHLIAGVPPFAGKNVTATLMAVAHQSQADVQSLATDCPDALKAIIDRLLEKSPDDRFAAADEVITALQTVEDDLSVAPPPVVESPARRSSPTVRSGKPLVWITLAAAMPLLILLGVVFLWRTPDGTLRVEVNDPNVEVLIDEDVLTLRNKLWEGKKKAGKHRLTIMVGDDELTLGSPAQFSVEGDGAKRRLSVQLNGATLSSNQFTIVRDKKNVLKIAFEPLPDVADNNHPEPSSHSTADVTRPDAPSTTQVSRVQRTWASHLSIPVEKEVPISESESIALMLIPPGRFEMSEGFIAMLDRPFYMGKLEITTRQFQHFIRDSSYGHTLRGSNPDHPAESVSWNDARAFCRWLSEKDGRVYRLPTEAEWEWATRAGTGGPWFFGDDAQLLNEYSWSSANSDGTTHPVGTLRPNPWGLHDVYGNVSEWMQDFHGPFPEGTVVNPTGKEQGIVHTVRGGGADGEINHHSHRQLRLPPAQVARHRRLFWGFRIVREIEGEEIAVEPPLTEFAHAGPEVFYPPASPITPADGSIDLLELIDPELDTADGAWKLSDGQLRPSRLVWSKEKHRARIALPVIPAGDYEFFATFTKRSTNEDQNLNILLPVGEHICRLNIALHYAGLYYAPGELNVINKPGFPLAINRTYDVKATVKVDDDQADIQVDLDGRRILSYSGAFDRFMRYGDHIPPNQRGVNLEAINEQHELTKIEMRMLSGEAKLLRPRDDAAEEPQPASKLRQPVDLRLHRELGKVDGRASTITVSPDGQTAAIGMGDGTFQWWDLSGEKDPETTDLGLTARIWGLRFSPDGKRLFVSPLHGDTDLYVFDAQTRKNIAQLKRIMRFAISPQGSLVIGRNTVGDLSLYETSKLRKQGLPLRLKNERGGTSRFSMMIVSWAQASTMAKPF